MFEIWNLPCHDWLKSKTVSISLSESRCLLDQSGSDHPSIELIAITSLTALNQVLLSAVVSKRIVRNGQMDKFLDKTTVYARLVSSISGYPTVYASHIYNAHKR